MKHPIIYISIFFILAFFGSSCEEVIDIELNTSEPKIVIDATITDEPGPYSIYISKSGDYFDPNEFPVVSGATVVVADDMGMVDTCYETEPGHYQTSKIQGQPDRMYSLFVKTEDNIYTAESYMPGQVKLDSLTYTYSSATSLASDDGYIVKCQFIDPGARENYYRLVTYKNGELYREAGNELVIWDDVLFDGKNANIPVKRAGKMFQLNDSLSVDLLTINREMFEYYTSLKNSIASGNSGIEGYGRNMVVGAAAPANPPSNISNGALGYFATYCVSSKKTIIEDK